MKIPKERLRGHLQNCTKKEIYSEWIEPINHYYSLVAVGKAKSTVAKQFVSRMLAIKPTLTKDLMIDIAVENYDIDDHFKFVVDNADPSLLTRLVWYREVVELVTLRRTKKYDLLGLKVTDSYYDSYVYVDPVLARRYSEFMPKPRYYEWVAAAPNLRDQHFSNEKDIFSIFPRLIDLIAKDLLKVPPDGKVSTPTLKKLIRELGIPEFFDEVYTARNKYLNTHWLVMLAKFVVDKNKEHLPMVDILKFLVNAIKEGRLLIWEFMLPQYSRVRAKTIFPLASQILLIDAVTRVAEQNVGVSAENYLSWLDFHFYDISPIELVYSNSLMIKSEGSYGKYTEVNRENYADTVLWPFRSALIYLLGSLGLVELYSDRDFEEGYTLDDDYWDATVLSPFFRLTHFSISDLGKYILGVSDDYTSPDIDFVSTQIEFDTSYLTISLSQPDEMVAGVVKQYTNQVSEQLFVADKVSFLRGVDTLEDLEVKVQRFNTFFKGHKLPDQWNDFFKSLHQLFKPLIKENSHYTSFIIPEDGHEIMHLLRTDEKLRALYIKAAGRRILVQKANLAAFASALRKHGWVL